MTRATEIFSPSFTKFNIVVVCEMVDVVIIWSLFASGVVRCDIALRDYKCLASVELHCSTAGP